MNASDGFDSPVTPPKGKFLQMLRRSPPPTIHASPREKVTSTSFDSSSSPSVARLKSIQRLEERRKRALPAIRTLNGRTYSRSTSSDGFPDFYGGSTSSSTDAPPPRSQGNTTPKTSQKENYRDNSIPLVVTEVHEKKKNRKKSTKEQDVVSPNNRKFVPRVFSNDSENRLNTSHPQPKSGTTSPPPPPPFSINDAENVMKQVRLGLGSSPPGSQDIVAQAQEKMKQRQIRRPPFEISTDPDSLNRDVSLLNLNSPTPKSNQRDDATIELEGKPTPNSRNGSQSPTNVNPFSFACGAALTVAGGVGMVVETCFADMNRAAGGSSMEDGQFSPSENSFSRKGSLLTLDTDGRELEDDMSKLERMTSWDTLESTTTAGTLNTCNENDPQSGVDDRMANVQDVLDDDGNVISAGVIKAHQTRKQHAEELSKKVADSLLKQQKQGALVSNMKKNTKKKRRKVVQFEHPPISSLRECPRITEEEREALFFTEDELDQYDYDRRNNHNDDVEVVAVHEEESEEEEERDEPDKIAAVDSLEVLKEKKPPVQSSSFDQSVSESVAESVADSVAGSVSSNKKIVKKSLKSSKYGTKKRTNSKPSASDDFASKNKNSETVPTDNSQGKYPPLPQNQKRRESITPPTSAIPQVARTASEESSKRRGKLKGVQIYLRQRS